MADSEKIAAAIAANDIKVEEGEIKAKVGDVEHKRPYRKLVALTLAGAAALCGDRITVEVDEKGEPVRRETSVLGHFNYGYDLNVKAKERQTLMAAVEGPEKTIAKAAKALSALLGVSEEDAAATIRAQMAAKASAEQPADEPAEEETAQPTA